MSTAEEEVHNLEDDDDDDEELETEVLFEAYAVVGPVTPLEPTDETLGMWQDRATDVVDVGLVAEDEEPPEGYVALRRTPNGACAALYGTGESRFFLCVKRRGRERRSDNEPAASALRAVTQLRIIKNTSALDDDSGGGTTLSRALFGTRRASARGASSQAKNELWKIVQTTAAGKGNARLRNGWLAVRFARLTDARKEPMVDIAVLTGGERAPIGYSTEASVPGGSGGNKILGGSLLSHALICVKRGKRCGACDVTWRAAVLDTYPRWESQAKGDPATEDTETGQLYLSSSAEKEQYPIRHQCRRASSSMSTEEKVAAPLAAWLEWEVVAMLTWPNGLKLQRGSVSSPPPVSFAAYSLVGDGRRPTYVSALYFYEPLQSSDVIRARRLAAEEVEPLDASESGFALYAPKCVCLLTRTAGVADAAKRWLASLYTLALSCNETPLEHIVAHTVNRIPAPVRGGAPLSLRMHASLPPIEMRLNRQPPDAELTPLGASASVKGLFACLSPSRCAAVLGAALLEKRLLFISKRPQLVTDACEAIRAMLYPLRWEGVYVPRLARPILDTLDFPGAIMAGVEDEDQHTDDSLAALAVERARGYASSDTGRTNYYHLHNSINADYVLVFLDVDKVVYQDNEHYRSLLPEPLCGALIKRWSKVCDHAGIGLNRERDRAAADHVFDNAEPPSVSRGAAQRRKTQNKTFYDSSDDEHNHDGPPEWTSSCDRAARDAALVLMVQLLNEYAEYLVVPKVDYYSVSSTSLFRNEQFIQSAPGSAIREFRRTLITTQAFARFIQRRLETTDPELVLFDECAAALRSAAEVHTSAIVRGDALLLDAVDAAHHMKRLLAKSAEAKVSNISKEEYKSPRTPVGKFISGKTERRTARQHTPSSTRSERLDWHRSSSRWLDEMLLKAPAARNAGCIAGTDSRGRPRIDVPPAVFGRTKDDNTPKRYSYFVLGRGLCWPCPLDEALLPSLTEQRMTETKSRNSRRKISNRLYGSDTSSTTRALARSQAEILLDMGLSVAGLRLGGGETSRGSGPLTPPIAADVAARAASKRQLLHAYGAWFLFAPALVNAHRRQLSKKEGSILRGLGAAPPPLLCALGVLERVVTAPCDPDEAIFRALLVAAGRSGPACRPIVADLFTQLRQKGIRPNTLTLCQYTRAIAQHTESSEDYRFFVPKTVANLSNQKNSNNDNIDDDSRFLSRLTILQDQKEDETIDENEPPLIAALTATAFLGAEFAALLRLGLDRHRHLRGLGHVARFSVHLQKPMGIIFEERANSRFGVFVSRLKPNSNAERSGLVRPGDVLIAVGETRCDHMDFDTCIQLIKAENLDTIHIVLERSRATVGIHGHTSTPVVQETNASLSAVPAGKPPSPEDDDTEFVSTPDESGDMQIPTANLTIGECTVSSPLTEESETWEASQSCNSSAVDVDIVVQKVPMGGLEDEVSEVSSFKLSETSFPLDESLPEAPESPYIETVNATNEIADDDQKRTIEETAVEAFYVHDESSSINEDVSAESFHMEKSSDIVADGEESITTEEVQDNSDLDVPESVSNQIDTEVHGNESSISKQVEVSDAAIDQTEIIEMKNALMVETLNAGDQNVAKENMQLQPDEDQVNALSATIPQEKIIVTDEPKPNPEIDDINESNIKAEDLTLRANAKGRVQTQQSNLSIESNSGVSDSASKADSTESDRARHMSLTTFVPSRESLAKAAVALSGAVDVAKASTKALGDAGGAAYDYSARRLASLVEEGPEKHVAGAKEGVVSVKTSASLFNLLEHFESQDEKRNLSPHRVAIIWSGCVSPHHPREPPLDEEIMAAWPEELGQREVRCPFTARPYIPQLAYAVLELAESPPGEDSNDIWVRLWRPQEREKAAAQPTLEHKSLSGELLSLHQDALSSAWSEGTAIVPFPQEKGDIKPIRLSALLKASGVETAEKNDSDQEDDELFSEEELRRVNCELSEGTGRCAYLSPLQLRYDLELQLQRHGERALETANLALKAPALFWSLWWYCARLELPLPTLPSRRKALSFCTPQVAVAAWSRKAALAAGAAALRSKKKNDINLAAKEAMAPTPTGLFEPVRAALLGPSVAAEKAPLDRAAPSERVLDACALFLDIRSSTADVANLKLVSGADDPMYRVLLRLNEANHLGFIPFTGSRETSEAESYEDRHSTSLFDHAYRQALTTLDQSGVAGLQSRDHPCSERAVIFRTIFSPLF